MTRSTWRLLTVAVAATTGASVAVAPLISTSACTVSSGSTNCVSGSETLVASEGRGILLLLAVPAVIALVPAVLRSRRAAVLSAVILTSIAVLGAASIGLFLVPTVVLAWLAARGETPAITAGHPR